MLVVNKKTVKKIRTVRTGIMTWHSLWKWADIVANVFLAPFSFFFFFYFFIFYICKVCIGKILKVHVGVFCESSRVMERHFNRESLSLRSTLNFGMKMHKCTTHLAAVQEHGMILFVRNSRFAMVIASSHHRECTEIEVELHIICYDRAYTFVSEDKLWLAGANRWLLHIGLVQIFGWSASCWCEQTSRIFECERLRDVSAMLGGAREQRIFCQLQ